MPNLDLTSCNHFDHKVVLNVNYGSPKLHFRYEFSSVFLIRRFKIFVRSQFSQVDKRWALFYYHRFFLPILSANQICNMSKLSCAKKVQYSCSTRTIVLVQELQYVDANFKHFSLRKKSIPHVVLFTHFLYLYFC